MAIQTIGIKMIAQGAGRFVSDVAKASNAVYNFASTVNRTQKAVVRQATTTYKNAEQQYRMTERWVNQIARQYVTLQNAAVEASETLQQNIARYQAAIARGTNAVAQRDALRLQRTQIDQSRIMLRQQMQNLANTQMQSQGYQMQAAVLAQLDQQIATIDGQIRSYNAQIGHGTRATNQLAQAQANLTNMFSQADAVLISLGRAEDFLFQKEQEMIDSRNDLNNITGKTGGATDILSGIIGILTNNFGQNTLSSMGLEGALLKLGLKFTAVTMILDVAMIAFNLFGLMIKALVGTVKLLWNVLTKILDIAVKVGKAIITWGVEAFKKFIGAAANLAKTLISIPFKIVASGFNAIWESIKRIGEIAIGMNLSNLIWNLGTRIKDTGVQAVTAAGDFQLLTVRLRGLIQREQAETKDTPFSESLEYATEKAQELSFWVSNIAVKSIYKAEDIAKVYTLAMAYDMTSEEAKKLTMDVLNFATGMGLQDEAMVRIVENFGQMIAAGKMTGTELRDLSRGAFLPVNRILGIMGESLGLTQQQMNSLRADMRKLNNEEGVDLKGFFEAFSTMVGRDFPNALENASESWNVVVSNIDDFIESVIGWRVITPILDVVAKRMSRFLESLMGENTIKSLSSIGEGFGYVTDRIFNLVDSISGFSIKKVTDFIDNIGNLFFNIGKMRTGDTSKYFKEVSSSLQKLINISSQKAEKATSNIYTLVKELDAIGSKPIAESIKNISESLKPLLDMVWNDVFAPGIQSGFTSAWSWVKDRASFIYDTYIYPFLEDLWNNYFKSWFGNVSFSDLISGDMLGTALAGSINSAITWLSENVDIGKSFGDTFFNGIISWVTANSGPASSLVTTIATAVGSALKLALATAINFALGGLGTLPTGGPGGESPEPQPPLPIDVGTVQNQGGGLGKGGDSITQALSGFSARVDEMLSESLAKLDQWLTDNIGLWGSLKTTIEDIGPILDDIGGKFNGMSGIFEQVNLALSPLNEIFSDVYDILNKDGGTGFSLKTFIDVETLDMLKGVEKVLTGIHTLLSNISLFTGTVSEAIGIWREDSPEIDVGPMMHMGMPALPSLDWGKVWEGISGAFKTAVTDVSSEMSTFKKNHESDWEQLSNDLIGNSIITDMLTDIYNAITTKFGEINTFTSDIFVFEMENIFNNMNLFMSDTFVVGFNASLDEVVTYISTTFVPGVSTPIDTLAIAMFAKGKNIVQQLWDGMKEAWASFMAWWESQQRVFEISAKVSTQNTGNSGSKTGSKTQKNAASGMNMIVPSGYNRDDFIIGVSSGERVIVIPKVKMMQSTAMQYANSIPNSSFNVVNRSYYNSGDTRSIEKNYNWNVQTAQSYTDVKRAYDMARLIDPEDL